MDKNKGVFIVYKYTMTHRKFESLMSLCTIQHVHESVN